jgi:hypothetical protein
MKNDELSIDPEIDFVESPLKSFHFFVAIVKMFTVYCFTTLRIQSVGLNIYPVSCPNNRKGIL